MTPVVTLHRFYSFNNLGELFIVIINLLLLLVSIVAVIAIIYGGYQYITSAGNPETAQSGKNTITWAIIGLVISFASYIIINTITSNLT